MKLNIKKVATVLGSALMLGSTVGMAAAASFTPSSFTDGGVALVVGSNAALSDMKAATDLAANLAGDLAAQAVTGSTTTVEGGDSYKIEKTSTKFNLGDTISSVTSSSITDDNLPTLLADGKFIDNDNDEFDYTQKIDMNTSLQLTMFEDNDYKADAPTVGFQIPSGKQVLTYTLDFTDKPLWADLVTTEIPIMGKKYYVLSNSTAVGNSLTLLDSASTTTVAEGESTTVTVGDKSYEVSISFIGETSVKFLVNGQTTNSINELGTYKLSDGSFIGVKDILYSAKDSGVSKVEFSIGKGKLLLTNGSDIELNDETISDLSAIITNTTTELASISIVWAADDDLFVTEDMSITMPGFEAVKMSFAGLTYAKEEAIVVEADGDDSIVLKNFPLKDSTESINIVYWNGSAYTIVGKDSDNKLAVNQTDSTVLTYDGDTDDWFVASWADVDDSESYLMRFSNFKNESGAQRATLQYRKDGAWENVKVDAEPNDEVSIGSVELTISSLDKDTKVAVVANSTTGISFNTLYSKEGMKVNLPTTNVINATNVTTTYSLLLEEENKDDNLGSGNDITLTLGDNSNDEVSVTGVDMGTSEGTATEVGNSDIFRNFAYSELATESMWDKSGDQYKVTLTYHGSETIADVYVTAPTATITAGSGSGAVSNVGAVTVYDNEVSSVSGKNLIVIGGSCINSVAAELLGGAACDAAFTAKTGIKSGEALIKSFTRGTKTALLVAGYNAADTTTAITYLSNKAVNTTVGAAVKVVDANTATAITA